MSESDAGWPFLVTCVDSFTLRASVSSCFDLSNFWTLPVTSLPIEELDDDADGELLVLELDEPPYAEFPIDPVEPVAPLLVLSLEVLPEVLGLVLDESEEPPIRSPDLLDPVDVDDPVEPVPEVPADPLVCAHAGAATSSPAVARPATLPHSIFIFPLPLLHWRRTRHPAVVVVLASSTVVMRPGCDRRGGLSDRLDT
jgi:hypothetical protein